VASSVTLPARPAHSSGLVAFQFHVWIRYLYSSFLPKPPWATSTSSSELSVLLAGLNSVLQHAGLGNGVARTTDDGDDLSPLDALNQSPPTCHRPGPI
jgi:hypothetical protein